MPGWMEHYLHARACGINIDKSTAFEINQFLDRPVIAGHKLPHHALHNRFGVELAGLIWGEVGKAYAIDHIRLDNTPRNKRTLMSNKKSSLRLIETDLGKTFKTLFYIVFFFSMVLTRLKKLG